MKPEEGSNIVQRPFYKNSFLEPPLLSVLDVIDPEPISELVEVIDAAEDEEDDMPSKWEELLWLFEFKLFSL